MQQALATVQTSSSASDSLHRNLITQIDDLENQNRRNNIHLRGVPELMRTPDLIPSLTKLCNSLLGKEPDEHIEFDRAHRALWPWPQDVVCRIHQYSMKDDKMHKSRLSTNLKVSLSTDLSRRTLRLRAATDGALPLPSMPVIMKSLLHFGRRPTSRFS